MIDSTEAMIDSTEAMIDSTEAMIDSTNRSYVLQHITETMLDST
jgi:hypothetical protein